MLTLQFAISPELSDQTDKMWLLNDSEGAELCR